MDRLQKDSHLINLLEWYALAGVDECVQEQPVNYYEYRQETLTPMPRASVKTHEQVPRPTRHVPGPVAAVSKARELAANANTIGELKTAVEQFDGCALKAYATNTVFADGNPEADLMFIGEAPGAQEDAQGVPFCGPSGKLLDAMLSAIGLDRTKVYITNTVFWRPPGNRQPNREELAICEPFIEKHIALVKPKLLVLTGGTAVSSVLKSAMAMSRMRGRLHDYTNPMLDAPIPAMAFYHPAYLLRSPGQKKLAWVDLQRMKRYVETGVF